METFLHHVAASLLRHYGTDMSHLTVVFPGKRAGLFLEQALAELAPSPVWAPRYTTISELFQQLSPYTLCDSIESVARLYASYERLVEDAWPLDRFYSWGEILLSDFDDIDKHRVNPRQLFTNIADLRQLDDNSYISPEQEAALKQFFADFSLEQNTEIRERFLRLWNRMADIYDDFNSTMRADGVLYEGALQRQVVDELRTLEMKFAEGLQTDDSPHALQLLDGDFAIVGFNILSSVEEALFDNLQRRGKTLFFWDYDRFYMNDRTPHEAGYFILRNLRRYGNALDSECFDNLSRPPHITMIAATSENAQARFLPTWLARVLPPASGQTAPEPKPRENQVAVVLANEQLLGAVLHSLPTPGNPAAPRAVNVTMGYPLSNTPVYTLVDAILSLRTDGYEAKRRRFRVANVRVLRRHPFISFVDDQLLFSLPPADMAPESTEATTFILDNILAVLNAIPRSEEAKAVLQTLNVEAFFQAYTAVLRLRDLVQTLLPIGPHLMRRLVRSILQSRTIPFHGEPATGLQVMGLLETRALDFRHVAILSAGEGYLPRTSADSSFIPYNLREAFGLTTQRHKVAVYAYYFYRLLQRAESVTILYNESNIGLRQNEMSRFLRQIMAETNFPISHLRLDPAASPLTPSSPPPPSSLPQSPLQIEAAVPDASASGSITSLSPSAINAYTSCPRRYYYQFVCGMRIDPDPHDGLDAILFGQVFHRAAELFYRQLKRRSPVIHGSDLDPYLEQGGLLLEDFVRQGFRDAFFSQARDADGNVVGMPEEYTGILVIAHDVVRAYLHQLLRNDRLHTPFRIIDVEAKHYANIKVQFPEQDGQQPRTVTISTGGIIDRIDEVECEDVEGGSIIRVVDYKTGGNPDGPAVTIDRLFTDTDQHRQHVFQTILYATILAAKEQKPVAPCLFYVHRAGAKDYSPHIIIDKQPLLDVRSVASDFASSLRQLIAEILDPANTFSQTTSSEKCRLCPFRRLCDK